MIFFYFDRMDNVIVYWHVHCQGENSKIPPEMHDVVILYLKRGRFDFLFFFVLKHSSLHLENTFNLAPNINTKPKNSRDHLKTPYQSITFYFNHCFISHCLDTSKSRVILIPFSDILRIFSL